MGKFIITEKASGSASFVLKAGNGEVIGVSESYSSLSAAKAGVESVKKAAAAAGVADEGDASVKNPKFEIFTDRKGEIRFRLQARNGEIVLTSESYKAKASCRDGIKSVVENAASAETVIA